MSFFNGNSTKIEKIQHIVHAAKSKTIEEFKDRSRLELYQNYKKCFLKNYDELINQQNNLTDDTKKLLREVGDSFSHETLLYIMDLTDSKGTPAELDKHFKMLNKTIKTISLNYLEDEYNKN
ncbi:hypothetical protein IPH25_02750 [bacterium]|nr:MAG: hypothetical protein IPG37_04890 [bacterium]QQR61387.1 MAG: hypothetical protein IPH25_02750 [bacterium]QQR63093.1 MAG: hypothetical protein IPH67_01290 [bacterium]